jgi:Ca2+-transporting ATPase
MSLPKYPDVAKDPFLIDSGDVLDSFKTTKKGLSLSEVIERQKAYGKNELREAKKKSPFILFLKKFTEPLILLLLASATVSIIIGEKADAIGITVAVGIVATLGFIQEYRSEKSVVALKKLATYRCRVVRGGEIKEILAENLVPGDIVILNVGDRVPADLRLIDTLNLQVDESVLTGESEPAKKGTKRIEQKKTLLAEKSNVAFMGTTITNGKGMGVVTAIGDLTELGKISSMIQEVGDAKTPLQLKLDELGKQISAYAVVIIFLIFIIGVFQGMGLLEMFTVGISLAVAAIPEGLPIVVTITLALGVTRMAKRKAIIRRLPAVEALGATTVICSDKTGTLTQNEMTVKKIFTSELIDVTGIGYDGKGDFIKQGEKIDPAKDPHLLEFLRAGLFCNNAHLGKGLIGQPTEGALLAVAYKAGLEDQRTSLKRLEEVPFDSEKKWMMVRYKIDEVPVYFIKGATERILDRCKNYVEARKSIALSKEKRNEIVKVSGDLAGSGLRVIALAYGRDLKALSFLGLAGIMDPPREGVLDAIKEARESSVKVIMITGDSKETAVAITRALKFYEEGGLAISGAEIEVLSEEELSAKVDKVNVFYRTSPEHKMKIVKALKNRGNIVAMTGDGVNDAPALKIADIGIAMGDSGTDVAKEASEMILVDDNFATIVGAIEEGKSIYNNIKNFLRFEMTTSVAALSVIAIATLLQLPLPLNPIQILWINIIMDGPPAQSLGVEPIDKDLMKRPPRDPKEPVINRRMVFNIAFGAFIMVIGTLLIFFLELKKGSGFEKRAMTMAFTLFVMFQMFNALNCRSEEKSIFKLGLLSNKYLILAIGGAILMQLGVIYLPILQYIFDTVALPLTDLVVVTAAAGSVLILDEIKKAVM